MEINKKPNPKTSSSKTEVKPSQKKKQKQKQNVTKEDVSKTTENMVKMDL